MLRVAIGNVLMPETDWEALDRRYATAAHAARMGGSNVATQFACAMTRGSLSVLHSIEDLSQTGKAYFCAYSSAHNVVLLHFALNPNPTLGLEKLRDIFELEKAEVEDALGGDVMFMAFRPGSKKSRQAVFILPTQDDALHSSGVPKIQLQFMQSLLYLANLTLNNLSFERQSD